ncbi:hypothetical protein BGZ93_003658 [Podila epicladia]|nr:hypothetical protein BGZ92_000244 [Podila epicladia]KAG0100192.1 hypothetical protein BGZ93_003658 [Podila epicladia]
MFDHHQDGDKHVIEVTIRFFRLTNAQSAAMLANFPSLHTLRLKDVTYEDSSNVIPPHQNLRTLVLGNRMVTPAMVMALPNLESLTMMGGRPSEVVSAWLIIRPLFELFVRHSRHLKTVRLAHVVLYGASSKITNVSVCKMYLTLGVNAADYFPGANFVYLSA